MPVQEKYYDFFFEKKMFLESLFTTLSCKVYLSTQL